jgi:hypothetical protein
MLDMQRHQNKMAILEIEIIFDKFERHDKFSPYSPVSILDQTSIKSILRYLKRSVKLQETNTLSFICYSYIPVPQM